jgi:hypothetical protein
MARQRGRERTPFSGLLQSPDHVGRPARRRDPDDGVPLGHAGVVQVARTGRGVLVHVLHRPPKGIRSAGQDPDHEPWRCAESDRAFAGIQDAEPPGGPCPDINEPAALGEPVGDGIHRQDDLLGRGLHRALDQDVLGVHGSDEFRGAQGVQPAQFRMEHRGGPFGIQPGRTVAQLLKVGRCCHLGGVA